MLPFLHLKQIKDLILKQIAPKLIVSYHFFIIQCPFSDKYFEFQSQHAAVWPIRVCHLRCGHTYHNLTQNKSFFTLEVFPSNFLYLQFFLCLKLFCSVVFRTILELQPFLLCSFLVAQLFRGFTQLGPLYWYNGQS